MDRFNSPLRYPGGKLKIAGYVKTLIAENSLYDGTYIEAFAGGAGVALELLFSEYMHDLILNDADINIYAFWHSVVHNTNEFISLIEDASVTIDEWYNIRDSYQNFNSSTSLLERGFATFFLNRCNRSGIIKGGPIGGYAQEGEWKLDARFNKNLLIKRVKRIGLYKNRIRLFNMDAVDFIKEIKTDIKDKNHFIYLDPPYFQKGQELYLNYYHPDDHQHLSIFVKENMSDLTWMISYDNCPEIKRLYTQYRSTHHTLNYSVTSPKKGSECVFYSEAMKVPQESLDAIEIAI